MDIRIKPTGICEQDTKNVQDAIDFCTKAGGGNVILEGGCFISGTLILKSNVYIKVESGAVLKGSASICDYRGDTHYNRYRNESDLDRCFIYAEDAENIGICGNGMIDGNSESFPNEHSIYRPMMIRFLRCSNIRISDIKLYNAAAWTTAFLDSTYIWVSNVDILNERKYNGDGLDFDGCSHVYISNCNIKGTDDNLCLQSSSKKYPVTDIHIMNCSFSSICAAIRIGLKSIGTISEVVISNCTMRNVWREGIKIECTEGGDISNILIQNITMHNVRRPVFMILNNRYEPEDLGSSIELTEMPAIGTISRIFFSDILAVDDDEMQRTHRRFDNDVMGSPKFAGVRIDANREHPIRCVGFRNFYYRFIGGVKKREIPKEYPIVVDKRAEPDQKGSENYYPDWSRAACMDIRNVRNCILEQVFLEVMKNDERPEILLEGCSVIKKDIQIIRE